MEVGLMDAIKIGAVESLPPERRRPAWARRRHRVLGAAAAGQPSIALSERAFSTVHRHAAGSDAEIGGLLLGQVCAWDGATHVEVHGALPAEWTRAGPVHLTFTADSWAGMLARKEREHPGATIVGWYHSHPRMGIFLSDMDLGIHHGFFREPWHVALVVNGQDRTAGFFAWADGKVQPARHLIWLPRDGRRRELEIAADGGRLSYQPILERPDPSTAAANETAPGDGSRLALAALGLLFTGFFIAARFLRRRRPWRR
jgi:proteasome lid subunit RPN8/RPN11